MNIKNLKILFVCIAIASLVITLGYALLVSSQHLLLGFAISAASASIAADPEFVLQDAGKVLQSSDSAPSLPTPIGAGLGLLLSLTFLAGWLYMNLFR